MVTPKRRAALDKHPGGIDMPRKGALDIARAAKVFGFRPCYDLRAGFEAYVRGE
jgi:hypothetical protein